MTEPFTPADLDLRDFPYMPLDVVRLRDSESAVMCTGEEFRAAVLLWCAAWHQVPAASLPTDDRLLANLAGYGRDVDGWLSVREGALRGFVQCSDGRFYHPVIAEKANEADTKRKGYANKMAKARAALAEKRASTSETIIEGNDSTIIETNKGHKGREGKGIEGKVDKKTDSGADAPNAGKRKREKKYATALPDNFEPNWEAATRVGLSRREAERELMKFKNHAAQTGRTCVNWQAAWSNWCINAAQFLKKPPPGHSTQAAKTITPASRSWNAWKSHFRDANDNIRASIMDKCGDEGRPFTVSSEWPPGHEMNDAA